MWRHRRSSVEKEFFETVRPSSLLKRFALIEEVASLVIFMASRFPPRPTQPLCVWTAASPLDHWKKVRVLRAGIYVELQLSAAARVVLFVIAALLPVVNPLSSASIFLRTWPG
jgi:hypothetical protein